MNRRQDSKEETRRMILDAARELFWEIGVETCTMRRVAAKAGVSPASVVVHFKSKTSLLEAALYEAIEEQLGLVMAEIPEEADLETRLMWVPRHMLRFYDKNRELYRVLIRDTVFEPAGSSPLLTELNERYLGQVAGVVAGEQAAGRVKPDVDPMLASVSMFCLYLGVLMEFLRNHELSVEQAIEVMGVMGRQFLWGICHEAGPAETSTTEEQ